MQIRQLIFIKNTQQHSTIIMATCLSADAANALGILAEAAIGCEAELGQYNDEIERQDSDEENGSSSPILNIFYERSGGDTILQMQNFSFEDFNGIWQSIEEHVADHYNVGRGRKCPDTPRDLLFITLNCMQGERAIMPRKEPINGIIDRCAISKEYFFRQNYRVELYWPFMATMDRYFS